MANTQAVTATKWERKRSCHTGVRGPRITGTQAATIGISRTAASVAASAATRMEAPEVMAPTSSTWLGSAHMEAVMNTAWPMVSPLSRHKTPKPTKEVIRISAGMETMPAAPRQNQAARDSRIGGRRGCHGRLNSRKPRLCKGAGAHDPSKTLRARQAGRAAIPR